MEAFFVALISFFLIDPLKAEMGERFGNLSPATVSSISRCVTGATPVLIRQAGEDPWWAATNVVGIWSGMTPPEEVLTRATPECATAIAAARDGSNEPQS